jgi:hypothetical protein
LKILYFHFSGIEDHKAACYVNLPSYDIQRNQEDKNCVNGIGDLGIWNKLTFFVLVGQIGFSLVIRRIWQKDTPNKLMLDFLLVVAVSGFGFKIFWIGVQHDYGEYWRRVSGGLEGLSVYFDHFMVVHK